MLRLETPDHAGSRDQAVELARRLPDDLTGEQVEVDCARLVVGTRSFFDEIVKQILELRHADGLDLTNAPRRAREHAEQSPINRRVLDQLLVE